jgi:DNA-directed RNA polymerase subunit beta
MGSNMQRQAVPVIKKEKAIVQTGLERSIAQSSESTLAAKNSGIIKFVSHSKIIAYEEDQLIIKNKINRSLIEKSIKNIKLKRQKNFKKRIYELETIKKSNQSTIMCQSSNVSKSQWVKKGQIITDGSGTYEGEITLGKNLLIGYIGWEGYNFEDAVVINKRLIEEDTLSSIHIKRYKIFLVNDNIGEVRTKSCHVKVK